MAQQKKNGNYGSYETTTTTKTGRARRGSAAEDE